MSESENHPVVDAEARWNQVRPYYRLTIFCMALVIVALGALWFRATRDLRAAQEQFDDEAGYVLTTNVGPSPFAQGENDHWYHASIDDNPWFERPLGVCVRRDESGDASAVTVLASVSDRSWSLGFGEQNVAWIPAGDDMWAARDLDRDGSCDVLEGGLDGTRLYFVNGSWHRGEGGASAGVVDGVLHTFVDGQWSAGPLMMP